MRAGRLNRRVIVQRRQLGQDPAGQPLDLWTEVGPLMAGIAGETGLGAIRSGLQGGVPASIARYSFEARLGEVQAMGINAGMRILYDGDVYEIKGTTKDLRRRDRAFIICEQGGNNG